jgi:hypothetical protein
MADAAATDAAADATDAADAAATGGDDAPAAEPMETETVQESA